MDALSPLLEDLRLQEGYHCLSELQAPWGASFPAGTWCSFEYVVKGKGWLSTEGSLYPLQAGDFCLLPPGRAYSISNPPGTPTVPYARLPFEYLAPRVMRLRMGGSGENCVSICGGAQLGGLGARHLLEGLPGPILLHREETPWLSPLMDAISLEVGTRRRGTPAILTRLIEALLLQALRAWAETAAQNGEGWLGALQDPQIGRALACLHAEPGRPWNLADLAKAAGCSRTVFAGRFLQRVGCTPMHYLARWRMDLASHWLREGQLSLAEVAERLAYRSEAAFSRAFKRHLGVAPGIHRRGAAKA